MTALPSELVDFLDTLPEPHILFDEQYRILAANAAYRRRFGERESVVGRTCYEVSHHFDRPCDQAGESCPLTQARQSGQRERVLHLHHTPLGEAYVDIELIPLRNPEGALTLFVEKMDEVDVAGSSHAGEGLVGRSAPFRDMLELVARVGPASAAVLLRGESGTGKELVARAVHAASKRAKGPLVVVECASLTEALFESELFGHEKGAFTGATSAKPGLVEAASGGTLFLDEVGDIPLPMQVKLLRLLESGTYRRVGSTALRRADVRVVSATHRDLPAMIKAGLFREDLFHRLSVFPIDLPPLRERGDDLLLLANSLLRRIEPDRPFQLSHEAMAELSAYPFPGNVRELRNVMERVTLLCDGDRIEAAHVRRALSGHMGRMEHVASGEATPLPPAPRHPSAALTLKDIEAQELRAQFASHRGTRAELARKLGISPRSLYRKLRTLGVS